MLDKPGEAYRLERNAFKHEYSLPDVDGRHPDEDDKTGGGTWTHVPEKLSTDLDLDSIFQRVSSELKMKLMFQASDLGLVHVSCSCKFTRSILQRSHF